MCEDALSPEWVAGQEVEQVKLEYSRQLHAANAIILQAKANEERMQV